MEWFRAEYQHQNGSRTVEVNRPPCTTNFNGAGQHDVALKSKGIAGTILGNIASYLRRSDEISNRVSNGGGTELHMRQLDCKSSKWT